MTELPTRSFKSAGALRAWLMEHHATSPGLWVRIFNADSGVESVTFEDVLDEGLCVGWSESMRRKGDEQSFLQRFTPRRSKGTTSKRNWEHIERLIAEGRMMPSGLNALTRYESD